MAARAADTIKTGVAQFGLGLSVALIEIRRHTNTNKVVGHQLEESSTERENLARHWSRSDTVAGRTALG